MSRIRQNFASEVLAALDDVSVLEPLRFVGVEPEPPRDPDACWPAPPDVSATSAERAAEVVWLWCLGREIRRRWERPARALLHRRTYFSRTMPRRRYKALFDGDADARTAIAALKRLLGPTRPTDPDGLVSLCRALADTGVSPAEMVDVLDALQIERAGVDRVAAIQRVSVRLRTRREANRSREEATREGV